MKRTVTFLDKHNYDMDKCKRVRLISSKEFPRKDINEQKENDSSECDDDHVQIVDNVNVDDCDEEEAEENDEDTNIVKQ